MLKKLIYFRSKLNKGRSKFNMLVFLNAKQLIGTIIILSAINFQNI